MLCSAMKYKPVVANGSAMTMKHGTL